MDWRKMFQLESAAIGSAAAAVYAAGVMLYRAYVAHTGVLNMDLLVAAGAAIWLLYTRSRVTPLAQPRDAEGRALTPAEGDI